MPSRAITPEEARKAFLDHAKRIANYWATVPDQTPTERCDGVVFSLLVMFDGCSGGMPAMDIGMSPHPDDKEFMISLGENWYEEGQVINADTQLHEEYYK